MSKCRLEVDNSDDSYLEAIYHCLDPWNKRLCWVSAWHRKIREFYSPTRSSWRNRLARSTVNRKVGGSSPPEDDCFAFWHHTLLPQPSSMMSNMVCLTYTMQSFLQGRAGQQSNCLPPSFSPDSVTFYSMVLGVLGDQEKYKPYLFSFLPFCDNFLDEIHFGISSTKNLNEAVKTWDPWFTIDL